MKNQKPRTKILKLVGALAIALAIQPNWLYAAESETTDDDENIEREEQVMLIVSSKTKGKSLQDTAAAITAIGADTFQKRAITDLAGMQNLIPSVRLQREGVSTEIYIRGVGTTTDFPMIEPPNAYNINGVYIPREVTSATLVDVDRIEVMPGPQGTLYGRGAIGGVINMITGRPTGDYETKLIMETGSYSLARVAITQNVPLTDNLNFRGTLSYNKRDGYQETGADSADDKAAFLSMNYSPSDKTNVFVWGHFETKGGEGANLVSKGENGNPESQRFQNSDPWDDRLIGENASFATLGPITAEPREWDTTLIGAEITYEINKNLTLTYIPSYLDFEFSQTNWITHKATSFTETIEQSTHELLLNYDAGGNFSYVAGLYNYNINTAGQLFIQFGPDELFPFPAPLWLDASDIRDHTLKGTALFGDAVYSVSDSFRLVFGGRISKDERDAFGFIPNIVQGVATDEDPVFAFGGPIDGWSNSESWDNVDWKVGIESDTDSGTLLYATLQTGFQPGTFDVFPDSVTEESKLLALTSGFKGRFANGKLLLNTEVFYYQYDDLLTQAFDGGTGANRLLSADTTISGVQVDMAYSPESMTNTDFKLSIGYLDADYDEFNTSSLSESAAAVVDTYNGNQLQNAPDLTLTFGVGHTWELNGGAYVHFDLSTRYESEYWGDFSHSSGIFQEAYTKTDVNLGYYSSDDSWSVSIWIKNLEDQAVQAAAAPGSAIFDPGPGAVFLEAPRTFGITYSLEIL